MGRTLVFDHDTAGALTPLAHPTGPASPTLPSKTTGLGTITLQQAESD